MTDSANIPHDLTDLGDRETDIMQALWGLDHPASVNEVHEELGGRGITVAYTTVQTMLNRLVEKGRVGRNRKGRAYLYSARSQQASVAKAALRRVVDRFFDGSSEALATQLVGELDDDELKRVRALIDDADEELQP